MTKSIVTLDPDAILSEADANNRLEVPQPGIQTGTELRLIDIPAVRRILYIDKFAVSIR